MLVFTLTPNPNPKPHQTPSLIKGGKTVAARVFRSSIAGGIGSVLGGGKFANGAVTGAFSRLFNDELHNSVRGRAAQTAEIARLRQAGMRVIEGVGIDIVQDGKSVRAIADYLAVDGKNVIIGEIKDGLGSRFSMNQKAVYDAVLNGRVRIINPSIATKLGIRIGQPYVARLSVHALGGAGSRVAGQIARRWGVRIAGAATILGSGVASAADLFLYSSSTSSNADCPGCVTP